MKNNDNFLKITMEIPHWAVIVLVLFFLFLGYYTTWNLGYKLGVADTEIAQELEYSKEKIKNSHLISEEEKK